MCARYEHKKDEAKIKLREKIYVFGAVPRANIRPTDLGPIILPADDDFVCREMRWGWQVPWDKSPLINAKCETLLEHVGALAGIRPAGAQFNSIIQFNAGCRFANALAYFHPCARELNSLFDSMQSRQIRRDQRAVCFVPRTARRHFALRRRPFHFANPRAIKEPLCSRAGHKLHSEDLRSGL